jgi:hypothetical protein
MGTTIFWGFIVFGALMLVLFFGYKSWRRNKTVAMSRRRSHHRAAGDDHRQIRQPQPGNTADEATQLGQALKRNSADARTVSRPSQNAYLEDAQTKIREDQKVKPSEEQAPLPHPQPLNSADAPTQIGREQTNKIAPEDDRTIL